MTIPTQQSPERIICFFYLTFKGHSWLNFPTAAFRHLDLLPYWTSRWAATVDALVYVVSKKVLSSQCAIKYEINDIAHLHAMQFFSLFIQVNKQQKYFSTALNQIITQEISSNFTYSQDTYLFTEEKKPKHLKQ